MHSKKKKTKKTDNFFFTGITCATLSNVAGAQSIVRVGSADCTATKSNFGDTCTLNCQSGFERIGTSSVSCISATDPHSLDGKWSETLGTCQRKSTL